MLTLGLGFGNRTRDNHRTMARVGIMVNQGQDFRFR